MATKPSETYKWGENATHDQVAAYEDTGWPSDAIPPKRTQFNWYQNLVGRWLEWAEDAVDEIVETVLDRWFTIVYNGAFNATWKSSIPNDNGFYEFRLGVPGLYSESWFVVVTNSMSIAVKMRGDTHAPSSHFTLEFCVWDSGQNMWVRRHLFDRANTRSDILQESEANYVTPKGLVDYFKVDNTVRYQQPTSVPHQSGVYFIRPAGSFEGVSIVIDDTQAFISFSQVLESASYIWDGSSWVLQ